MASTSNHGTICWLEIPVLSASRAAAFYTTVFGWDCSIPPASYNGTSSSSSSSSARPSSPMNIGPASIHMFRKRGGHGIGTLHGAFIQVPEGCLIRACEAGTGEMAVLTTFAVESIEETLEKVVEMGGNMHSPKTVIGSNMGCFARFIDCEGNLHGIWAQK